MRFEQLRYLDAAVRAGTLRKAASDMGLAQPSLSQQIQRLEEELNTVLLLRSSSGVRPTDACEMLLPHLRAALRGEDALLQEASALGGVAKGRVRVGAVGLPTRTLLPQVVRQFQKQYPGVHLEAHEGFSEQIRAQVVDGDLDLGVISRFTDSTAETNDLRTEDILSNIPLYVCVPEGHPLHGKPRAGIADLKGEAFITSPVGHLLRTALDRISEQAPVRVVYYTDTSETVRIMVQAGVGIAILSRAPRDGPSPTDEIGLGYVQLAEPWAEASLSLIRRRHEQSTPAVRALRQIIVEQAQTLAPAPAGTKSQAR